MLATQKYTIFLVLDHFCRAKLKIKCLRSLLLLMRRRSSHEKEMDDNHAGSFGFFGLPSEGFLPHALGMPLKTMHMSST